MFIIPSLFEPCGLTQELNNALKRAFDYYTRNPENWRKLVQNIMRLDFSWDSSAQQYEELYEKAVIKARAAANLA
ncbi:hypothetical protein KSP39_PZI005290 [Platanthera zijinensis]|uniref:starch synthase n=1 Tax=Platanthera zijinensis TaxID=2320716 RepID=A0AAP0BSE8_9ASPA